MTDAYQMDIDQNGNEYEETDVDLQDLCEDVTMLDVNEYDNYKYGMQADFDDEDELKQEQEPKKRNKWEEAANKGYENEDELEEHTDSVLPESPFK
eukprot:CAMPEP_0201571578 /NCGR_PEP_ID=MMETSP0190_2-20130828/14433_1 /ASSEMBLY_ACC=CAM_ASM_000263 /TAXON_ID=37353 /ORGANISM="Rosalina sp." /LENGTH=95 /DNA_ID=CAMNT_0047996381 /DNA_START=1 /DNA_END=285 /DNA_ORIENTATION=-